MLSFNISYPDLIKNLYFADTMKEGFERERRPKDRVTLRITLLTLILETFDGGLFLSLRKCSYMS